MRSNVVYQQYHHCLFASGDKLRVADNTANLAVLLEGPLSLIRVGESYIDIRAPENSDGVSSIIQDLTTLSRVNKFADTELNRLKGTLAAYGGLLLARASSENSLRSRLGSLIAEHNADLKGIRANLDESRVADDLADLGGLTEGPGPLVGVREGDICVRAADRDDGLACLIEGLATVLLVLDILADFDFDGLEGAAGGGGLVLADAALEGVLGARLGGLVAEYDADRVVRHGAAADALGGCEGARGGEKGEDGGFVLHFEYYCVILCGSERSEERKRKKRKKGNKKIVRKSCLCSMMMRKLHLNRVDGSSYTHFMKSHGSGVRRRRQLLIAQPSLIKLV
ncbi:uncharacterized protein BCR38DRAFT_422428 [Pseudomassariella vexata]|uniref:Uncharacterized protein n=1 Tax=Pseudomassariella vexata TaxID=1141098 RepID=A0A1Y2E9Y8_9PEZI|nr:uncharacterized protein BCR38DRAFT_422428 [Pseudomassariella vexata]ORY68207.1 hypothetical protein BCR38DRAFT_422428 [Pseudomassariella vexata]